MLKYMNDYFAISEQTK